MNTTQSSFATRLKVGAFTLFGIVIVGAITVISNGKPFWWRPCQLVKINVEDATGLKTKSPIRSLGIEIGYLQSVILTEKFVTLGICITAPVEVLPATRAYIRAEGFLGDKFVELKPVKYVGPVPSIDEVSKMDEEENFDRSSITTMDAKRSILSRLWGSVLPEVWAANSPAKVDTTKDPVIVPAERPSRGGREIPVSEESQDIQHLVNRVDELVHQVKEAIHPEELRSTLKQLNSALENASKTLAPGGGLNQTAQRTLAKLEDAIEQLRDLMTRVNKGEGSVGMLLNDPSYADEIRMAIRNINQLLNRVGQVKFMVDVGGTLVTAYNGGRAWFQLGIWPKPYRYYLLGIAMDPRGRISNTTVTTTSGGITTTNQTQMVDQTGILITAMLGRLFLNDRVDASVGALYGDGAGSIALRLGPKELEDRIVLRSDLYIRSSAGSVDDRLSLSVQPFPAFYIRAGIESFRGYNGTIPFIVGAGIAFDDDDIKLLFALK